MMADMDALIRPPRTAQERQALWDAATDTDNPCTERERERMMNALQYSDLMYILGYLPADYLPPES
jgi:hypothetical protein